MSVISPPSTTPFPSATLSADAGPPICVDLDGTLLKTDTLYEGFMRLLAKRPFRLLRLPLWMLLGKARLKSEIERETRLDTASLPKNDDLIRYLDGQRRNGRQIFLYSGANQSIVERVAEQFDFFAGCRGSSTVVNLKGSQKLAAIRNDLGDKFVYAGDSKADLPIWHQACAAILIGKAARFAPDLPAHVPIEASFPESKGQGRDWLLAMRAHQWVKNILLFAPLLLSGHLPSSETIVSVLFGFIAFSLIASATYIFNDLLDLDSDRDHPTKRNRPFAAGRLPILQGLKVSLSLLLVTLVATLMFMPPLFAAAAFAYLLLTAGYSAGLKRCGPIDVVVLSCLFTVRILAGMAFVSEPISLWFLTFAIFFFLGLALIKRHAELSVAAGRGRSELSHRGYRVADLPIVASTGAASSLGSLLIFVTYLINEKFPQEIYQEPIWLWLITPILLAWTLRAWFITIRGEMHDDPIVFALKDRLSWALAFVSLFLITLAW